jgi:hypothetical protein
MPRTNPEARCPACQTTLDGASSMGDRPMPRPGDLSVCVYCTALLEFNTDLTLRLAPTESLLRLEPEQRIRLEMVRFALIRRP